MCQPVSLHYSPCLPARLQNAFSNQSQHGHLCEDNAGMSVRPNQELVHLTNLPPRVCIKTCLGASHTMTATTRSSASRRRCTPAAQLPQVIPSTHSSTDGSHSARQNAVTLASTLSLQRQPGHKHTHTCAPPSTATWPHAQVPPLAQPQVPTLVAIVRHAGKFFSMPLREEVSPTGGQLY